MCKKIKILLFVFTLLCVSVGFSASGFIENKGQVLDFNGNSRSDIKYVKTTPDLNLYFFDTKISYVLHNINSVNKVYFEALETKTKELFEGTITKAQFDEVALSNPRISYHRLDLEFVGGNYNPLISASNQLSGYNNYYYSGIKAENVKSYNKLGYSGVYEGIDFSFYETESKIVKYDIVVHPTGDVNDIKLKYTGADKVELENNVLSIHTGLQVIKENLPKIYQTINGRIEEVKSEYKIIEQNENYTVIGFQAHRYNKQYDLVIDPAVWTTYMGGTNGEIPYSVVADNQDNSIFCGTTASLNFPVTVGAFQTNHAGGINNNMAGLWPIGQCDAYLIKFDFNGNRLWSTYFGSTAGNDDFRAVCVDPNGNIVAGGLSTNGVIPGLGSGLQNTYSGGNTDGYLAKFNSAGNLVTSTYFGGNGQDWLLDVARDNAGNFVAVGYTTSSNLPMVGNTYQASNGGFIDIYIAKFNNNLNALQFSTYYGGTGSEYAFGVDVDSNNDICIVGSSNGLGSGFPTTAGAFQTTYGGQNNFLTAGGDGVILKFSSAGNRLWATYYGNPGTDYTTAVAVDQNDDIVICGITNKSAPANNTYFSTPGAFQLSHAGGGTASYSLDSYVAKFSPSGTRIWGTYLGGSVGGASSSNKPDDYAMGIAITSENDIVVTGDSYTTDFPNTTCSYQGNVVNQYEQIFITTFNPSGKLICSSLLVNSASASGHNDMSIFSGWGTSGGYIDARKGFGYLTAHNLAGNAPVTTGAFQTTKMGSREPIASRICLYTCGNSTLTASYTSTTPTICINQSVTYTGIPNTCDTTRTKYLWTFPGGTPATSTNKTPTVNYNAAGLFNFKLRITTPCDTDSVVVANYVTVSNPILTSTITNASCFGLADGQATASLSSGIAPYTYSWSNAQTNSAATFLGIGTYSVVVSDAIGCSATGQVTITEPPQLQFSLQLQQGVLCNGIPTGQITSQTSGGVGAYTYVWSVVNNTGAAASNLNAGIYGATVQDGNGCIASDTIHLNQPGSLIGFISTLTNVLCNGDATGSATAAAIGGVGAYTYSWSSGQNTAVVNSFTANTYTVTITDANGCTAQAYANITEPPLLQVSSVVQSTVDCFGNNNGSAIANPNGGTGSYTYSWSNGQQTHVANGLPAGTYQVLVTDANGCTENASMQITEPTALTAQITGPTDICMGAANASILATPAGGTPSYSFSWSNNQQTAGLNNIGAGVYNLVVTDANGCTLATSHTIQLNPALQPQPTFTVDKLSGCGPLCVNFINTTTNTQSLMWEFGSNGITSTNSSEQYCFTSPGSFNIALTVVDNNGCSATLTQTNFITVHPNPVAQFNSSVSETSILESQVQFVSTSILSNSLNWSLGDSTFVSTLFPDNSISHTYKDTGVYAVKLVVVTEFGCKDSTIEYIYIKDDYTQYIPNSFTPNGDGINDVFMPSGIGVEAKDYLFEIYNRWGEKIWSTKEIYKGWDGRANDGKLIAQQDVFIYVLHINDIYERKHRFVGSVTIIK
ncbi:MAG: gliding motility-associated C-terminal domain-containing protein [Bacteroidetes bacterium]|nr:gliding motility-associated C-terminal domain-containing protein [Bacteroidota bacterium]